MKEVALSADPYNLIVTGVGGQGNVLASRVIGDIFLQQGFQVTIGETFGLSQRGGSVMSHVRISAYTSFSPQIPRGRAHLVLALEPTEAIRVLGEYGNPGVKVLCNLRAIHSVGVISGELEYPAVDDLRNWMLELSDKAWFVEATEAAMELGSPIYANMILIGALAGTNMLPFNRECFEGVISKVVPAEKLLVNLAAFDKGMQIIS
jgi:indolepyruvate ferredoxin oxidoreductase beta subunit